MAVRVIAGLWRWRRNPLRRTTDLVEVWTSVAAVVLFVTLAPAVGVLCGVLTHQALSRTVEEQQRSRHRTVAVVKHAIRQSPMDTDPETSTARDAHSKVVAVWKAVDHTRHRGPVDSDLRRPRPGDRFVIWTDDHGRVVGRPLNPATASAQAVLAGTGMAGATACGVEAARRIALWRLIRRRHTAWDQAWERSGPDWGRAGADS